MTRWPRYYLAFLIGLGVSNIGNWLYLIALNVFVWRLTESPAAVAGIYIVGPVIRMISNVVAGSLIDRMNKKKLVILVDVSRALFIFLMPFASELWMIYLLIACTNVAATFFGPSSTYLITTLVREEHRLRFNAVNATCSSGAFMIGPALGGILVATTSIATTMWLNAASFLVCACLLAQLPAVKQQALRTKWSLKEDFCIVVRYLNGQAFLKQFLLLYTMALMLAFALDSQEMTFLLRDLHVSEALYGLTVSLAGIGAVLGGMVAATFAKKWSQRKYIQYGFSLTLLSYGCFYASFHYVLAVISLIVLGFCMAFSNSGYATWYQQTIEPSLMGRIGSVIQFVQAVLQVLLTLLLGVLAERYSLASVAIVFALIAFIFSLFIWKIPKPFFQRIQKGEIAS